MPCRRDRRAIWWICGRCIYEGSRWAEEEEEEEEEEGEGLGWLRMRAPVGGRSWDFVFEC